MEACACVPKSLLPAKYAVTISCGFLFYGTTLKTGLRTEARDFTRSKQHVLHIPHPPLSPVKPTPTHFWVFFFPFVLFAILKQSLVKLSCQIDQDGLYLQQSLKL